VDQLVVVTHPAPLRLEARELEHEGTPEGSVALGYYCDGHVVARGVVTDAALEAIQALLDEPVSLALAATEDESGNIEGRVCLVLPFDAVQNEGGEEAGAEPWRASVPGPPPDIGLSYDTEQPPGAGTGGDADGTRLALLPIGHVIRAKRDRRHGSVEGDVREMLDNLISGRARDAVSKAIDDLLDSL
jgi:hypothetical protein